VLTQSITNGRNSGLATTAGLISGCIVHTTLVAFGVSALIATSPKIFLILKILGAAYLLYLAIMVYRSDARINLIDNAPKKSYVALFKQGILMNILNPKVTLFLSFLIFGGIAIMAGSIAGYIKQNVHAGFVLKWIQIFVFIGIAVYIVSV